MKVYITQEQWWPMARIGEDDCFYASRSVEISEEELEEYIEACHKVRGLSFKFLTLLDLKDLDDLEGSKDIKHN